jgi:hypothetical protein
MGVRPSSSGIAGQAVNGAVKYYNAKGDSPIIDQH